MTAPVATKPRLAKELGLFDVYAISTGAMFSSGFFLLPGVAAASSGPSVVLAYLIASIFILPAMFSMAELATAMPRAGGAYYFLDRSLGPLAGTIGGIGTWLSLVLKSAFALIGFGAYLAIFLELPLQPLAVALTIAFGVINILGAKETTGLQRILVTALVGIMVFYVVQGLMFVAGLELSVVHREQFTPFLPFGLAGLFSTVGLVFVSYAGLTKVASVAEEVRNPDRNIPLGMFLSLLTATIIYVFGVYIMVAVLEPSQLRNDLTPVATAGEAFLGWLPTPTGLVLVVIAAIAAFASTGNAGILSASRYLLAMARDRLAPPAFAQLGRFKTPQVSVIATSVVMIGAIIFLNVENLAKLASAFQLLVFVLINFAVIVMRESRISSYTPGYSSPFYPWMQVAGIIAPIFLIIEMGTSAALFTVFVTFGCVLWYLFYAHAKVEREGAIYHLFARLGQRRFEGLDHELREIMKERKLEEDDPYEAMVARARVLDLDDKPSFETIVAQVSDLLAKRLPYTTNDLQEMFLGGQHIGATAISHGVALPDVRLDNIEQSEIVLVRVRNGIELHLADVGGSRTDATDVYALLFLVGSQQNAGQHLRILAELVTRVDEAGFLNEWLAADTDQQLREVLLRHERFITVWLEPTPPTQTLIGRPLKELDLPPSTLVALVQRGGDTIVPKGDTVLQESDRLTIIGNPHDIRSLYDRYGKSLGESPDLS
ncbi:MAG: amino acid permease [Trueperaceae bacterium]|nr:amino acid permease [Trueperaceae bacterium]